jgi:hypothetical protein
VKKCTWNSLALCLAHIVGWTTNQRHTWQDCMANGWMLTVGTCTFWAPWQLFWIIGLLDHFSMFLCSLVFLLTTGLCQRATFQSWLYRVNFWLSGLPSYDSDNNLCILHRLLWWSGEKRIWKQFRKCGDWVTSTVLALPKGSISVCRTSCVWMTHTHEQSLVVHIVISVTRRLRWGFWIPGWPGLVKRPCLKQPQ